jgi:hypothetical protein
LLLVAVLAELQQVDITVAVAVLVQAVYYLVLQHLLRDQFIQQLLAVAVQTAVLIIPVIMVAIPL